MFASSAVFSNMTSERLTAPTSCVIVRKSFTYSEYDDILAIALAKSSLPLNDKKAVGDYLFDNGYIGWRNLGKSERKILANAMKLREGGTI